MADLIDREELTLSLFPLGKKDAADVYKMVMDAPSVNRWIPCSERLPDDGQICIVKRKFDYEPPCPYMIGVWSSDRNMFSGIRLGTNIEDAIAWMPFIDPDEV